MTVRAESDLSAAEADRFDRAFARTAGSTPTDGNAVRLLLDAAENFPAWLAAIEAARHYVLFESYIVADDSVGRRFAQALAAKAREGVGVYVAYDWLGSTKTRGLWALLRAAGVHLACFNPPSFDSPLGWLTRDHRKSIIVDGTVAYVSGLCVSAIWEGDPDRRLQPWRDTGVEIRGAAVVELERAFTRIWATAGGAPIAFDVLRIAPGTPGSVRVRVIAGEPGATGTYRTDLLVASVAREHLWLTDAYFVATAAYTQALRAAAWDGVDVRLLVPGASDVLGLSSLSRAGYRALLEAGVRVFEWNGTMLHAKTAVADRLWSRVGSTNLNLASWMSNYELDVAIEDRSFAEQMAEQYERDLLQATEVVLTRRNRVRRSVPRRRFESPGGARQAKAGSAGRAAAGAVGVGGTLGAALTNRRMLGPAEAGLMATMACIVLGVAASAFIDPRVLAWPIGVLCAWLGLAWGWKAIRLGLRGQEERRARSGRYDLPARRPDQRREGQP
ncbi:MAG: phospholipase D-like domain-containing protein [Betaproteobacteria bacterium]